MNLASKSRTRLIRELDKVLGKPETMTDKKKRIVRELLGRWYYQKNYNGKKDATYRYSEQLTRKTGNYKPYVQNKYFYDAAQKSLACFPKNMGRTSIQSLIKHPDVAPTDAVLIPKPAGDILSAPRVGWDYLSRYGSLTITIVIPANYYATVKRHGVQMDGRKLIQRIWNHRVYEDKETWECMYWHLTSKVPTHHSGYICKTGTHISVHPTLEMALAMARKKTVAAAIKSIMKDETS